MTIAMVMAVDSLQAAAEQRKKLDILHKADQDTGLTWLLVSN